MRVGWSGWLKMGWCATAVAAASLVLAAQQASPQPLTLEEVLYRANERIVEYESAFEMIVAEEAYTQRILQATGEVTRSRKLLADFLFIRLPGSDIWTGFRDVIEVEGKEVRPAQERLRTAKIPSLRALIRLAQRRSNDSEEHYLGEAPRILNVPTLPLAFLNSLNQHRFEFEHNGDERIGGTDTWAVRFSERVRPALVQVGRADLFSSGTFWLDPTTGRVMKSQLILGDFNTRFRSRITTTYDQDAKFGTWVPREMREEYDSPRLPRLDRLDGEASYSNFQRLELSDSRQ